MREADSQGFDLGRTPLAFAQARQVAERIMRNRESSTFALVGDWGSGKTWLLEAMLRDLESNPDWHTARGTVVRFNPWYYGDEQALFAGCASRLVQQTLKKGRARARLADMLELVGPSAKFGAIDLTAAVKKAEKAVGVTAPSQIRNAVSEGLAKSGRQLLIVMDDLDRLNPDELLILFKLVRLVGDVPGLHYLLAYDEDTVHHLLKQTAIAGGSSERARRYLEKIVERRWEVPPLTDEQVDEILFSKLSLKEGDLHLTLLIRTAAPALWKAIVAERQLLVGSGPYLSDRDREKRAEAALERFRAATSDLAFKQEILDLVVDSFPSFSRAHDPQSIRSADAPRIGHRDFVNHYLWLDVPPGSISELAVTSALQRLPDEGAEKEIRDLLRVAPPLLLDSLWRNARGAGVSKPQVFMLLERLYRTHDVTATFGPFGITVDRRIFPIANDLLKQMSADELAEMALEEDYRNSALLIELVARLHARPDQGADELNSFVAEIAGPVANALLDRLESAGSLAFPASSAREDLLRLFELDSDLARSLLQRRVNAREWREDDIVSFFVRPHLSTSDGYYWHLDVEQMHADLGRELVTRVERALLTADTDVVGSDILAQVPAGERTPTAEEGRALTRFLFAGAQMDAREDEE